MQCQGGLTDLRPVQATSPGSCADLDWEDTTGSVGVRVHGRGVPDGRVWEQGKGGWRALVLMATGLPSGGIGVLIFDATALIIIFASR
jgi:hypothetical protein